MGEHGNIIDRSEDWYTPLYVFDALGCTFDLDVSAPIEGPRYVPAGRWFWERGLEQDWSGFVWMNPPFGHQSTKRAWLAKFIAHGQGIALLPDRTSAPWWQWAAPQMDALLFVSPPRSSSNARMAALASSQVAARFLWLAEMLPFGRFIGQQPRASASLPSRSGRLEKQHDRF